MAEIAKQDQEHHEAEVIDLGDYVRRHAPPPPTAEEMDEYRRMWPLVKQMLREWDAVKGPGGCPIAARIVSPED